MLDLDRLLRPIGLLDERGQWQPGALSVLTDVALSQRFRLPMPNYETWRKGGNVQVCFMIKRCVITHTRPTRVVHLLQEVVFRLTSWFQADPKCQGRVMRGLLHTDPETHWYRAEP